MESESDLIAATKLSGATRIYELEDAPGDGRCVTFYDPIDRFPFHLAHGKQPHSSEIALPRPQFNFVRYEDCHLGHKDMLTLSQPIENHRAGNKTQRLEKGKQVAVLGKENLKGHFTDGVLIPTGPAPVHKLGHFGMCVTDFTRSLEFYTTHFNFKPSDVSSSNFLQ